MRFGRRNKFRPPLLRSEKKETAPISSGTVASEERSALLAHNHDDGDAPMDYDNGPNEPTQSLLTALGRFQRQVAKAQTGARQDEWSDECMNQLIGAVEIAIEQDWVDVVEALTDTARLLHSYEDSSRANRCIPFLADSYELLCLMVGDLIVDNVRPSVMDKWRRRFAAALDDLQAEGLCLIQDDDGHDAGAHDVEPAPARDPLRAAAPGSPEAPESESPFADVSKDASDDPDAMEDDLPALDELPPLQGVERVGMESIMVHDTTRHDAGLEPIAPMQTGTGRDRDALPEMPMIGDVGYLPTDPEPFGASAEPWVSRPKPASERAAVQPADPVESEVVAERNGADEAEPVSHSFEEIESEFDADMPEPEVDEACEREAEEPEEDDSSDELYALDTPPSTRTLEPAVVQHLDALCDELARLERGEDLDRSMVFATIEGRLDSLRIHAHSGRRPRAEHLCRAMAALCANVANRPELLGDRFFEVAYAFCGLYADADGDEESPSESAWHDEIEALQRQDAPEDVSDGAQDRATHDVAEVPVFELPDDVEPDASDAGEAIDDLASAIDRTIGADLASVAAAKPSVVAEALLSLLTDAQKAAVAGDIAHAKALALEVAVKIAEAEVDESHQALERAERYLEENGAALEDAHMDAATAEVVVGECESQVTDSEAGVSEVRRRIADTQRTLDDVEQHIAEIEAQIRALEADRDAESTRADEVRSTLEQERRMESDGLTDLEQRRDEESRARERLENTQRRIASLESQREATQAERHRAEAGLAEKRRSMAELEQTIRQIQGRIGEQEP